MSIRYTRTEERLNVWSHAAGTAIAVAACTLLSAAYGRADSPWSGIGLWLYAFGVVSSYAASTAYHATPRLSRWRERLRRIDHAAIYWHIAGSYSPLTLVGLRHSGGWGWGLFAFVWLCAAAGTAASSVRLREHSNAETACFVGMGLSGVAAFGPLLDCCGAPTVGWIVAEGVMYISGAACYSLNKRRYMHSVFHFFVLAGTLCHIMALAEMFAHTAGA